MEDHIGSIVVLLILLLLSAVFSMSETALTSASKLRIRRMVNEGVRGARRLDRITDEMEIMLSTLLVGNNVVNIGASSLATSVSIALFGDVGVGLATGAMTLLVLIFGEITPKSIAQQDPEALALKVAPMVHGLMYALRPFTFLFSKITGGLVKIFVGGRRDRPQVTEEDVKTMASVGAEEGVIEDGEKDIIHNVFKLGDFRAEDVCVHRPQMVTLPMTARRADIMQAFQESKFSRYPVYGESVDDIKGILYMKDVFLREGDCSAGEIARKASFVYEHLPIGELMDSMRSQSLGMVIVIDEYRGVEGLVTMSDIIEEIFGNIEDEYRHDAQQFWQRENDRTWILQGAMEIEDAMQILQRDLPEGDYDTLGGMILEQLPSFPKEDSLPTLEIDGMTLTVLTLAGNTIGRVRVTLPAENTGEGDKEDA